MMIPLKALLAQWEARLRALVEGGAARLFPGALPDLAAQLTEAMHTGAYEGVEGELVAPDLYTLLAQPDMAQALNSDQAWLDELARTLEEFGRAAGLHFNAPPVVRVMADSSLETSEIHVSATSSQDPLPLTSDMPVTADEPHEPPPKGAFLIVNGVQVFPLEQAVINIGRRADNHIPIDDPRVSRLHAQLRLIGGRYVIFDLDSSGGTWVNGRRVHQCALAPGDVISLGGVPLVFGQDHAMPNETQELKLP